jgi:hypothetical protein
LLVTGFACAVGRLCFLTKSGDLGMVLGISGVDYESLDRSEQEYALRRTESASPIAASAAGPLMVKTAECVEFGAFVGSHHRCWRNIAISLIDA